MKNHLICLYPVYVCFLLGESASCLAMSGDVHFLRLEVLSKFPPHKTDRDTRLMYALCGLCAAQTDHESLKHQRITKFCILCMFSHGNKSVNWSDQAFIVLMVMISISKGLTLNQIKNVWTRPNSKHLQTTIQMLLKY